MAPQIGPLLKRTRQVRALSATDVARAAGISAAYLSKLEHGGVKKPSPQVLHQLSEALAVPYAELMRLSGYLVPGEQESPSADSIGAALFADITEDERDELLEYLAWYRARRLSARGSSPVPAPSAPVPAPSAPVPAPSAPATPRSRRAAFKPTVA